MELCSPKTKNSVIFQEGTCKASKSKISYFLFVERELFKYKRKRKKFLILSVIKEPNFLN